MQRFNQNPLIRPTDVQPSRSDFQVIGAFNAAVARYEGKILLLVRIAERPKERDPNWLISPIWNTDTGEIDQYRVPRKQADTSDPRIFRYQDKVYLTSISHLRLARSSDGVHFEIDTQPALEPATPTESFGLEDPRITQIDGAFWITYKAVSKHGITTSLAHTRDFQTFTRHGTLFCPENLDVVLFPEKIRGLYAAWTRPVGNLIGSPTIWAARSPDLLHWGDHQPVLWPRPGKWDAARVGSSCVPFRTEKGWLEIYHGASPDDVYGVGTVLIDHNDPTKVLARSDVPWMKPDAPYEKGGFFGDVVFPCGADVRSDGSIVVYYGAADESICAATTSIDELLHHLRR